MNNKNIFGIMVGLGIFVLVAVNVSAFAVSSAYWAENPVRMNPGETTEIKIVFQNLAGDGGDVVVKGVVSEGAEIAEFVDRDGEFSVPKGEKVDTYLRITLPENAVVSQTYEITLAVTTMSGDDGENFGFTTSIDKVIPVLVVQQLEVPSETNWYLIGGIIILIMVIAAVVISTRKSKKK